MRLPFAEREFDPEQPELMDQATLHDGSPSLELESDLANLRWLNRHFGAIALLHYFLERWIAKRPSDAPPLSVLDLATGEGDLPRALVVWCRAHKIAVNVDAVDLNPATLTVAHQRSLDFPEIRFHQGDIRSWNGKVSGTGESPGWPLVLCSLALHHFSEEDAVQVLRNARRLTTHHLLVADLERSLLGGAGIWLLTALLLREPMTVHDARLSIRRAFSYQELDALARSAGWKGVEQARFPITRQAIWIDDVGGL